MNANDADDQLPHRVDDLLTSRKPRLVRYVEGEPWWYVVGPRPIDAVEAWECDLTADQSLRLDDKQMLDSTRTMWLMRHTT